METKAVIRKRVLSIRDALSPMEVSKRSAEITKKVLEKKEYQEAGHIFLYLDFRNEVSTEGIWADAIQHQKKVFAPKILEGKMQFYEITDENSVEAGYFGIREPIQSVATAINQGFMLLPGSVFDGQKNRIGYGKGYYDTFLSQTNHFLKIALAYSFQMVESIPAEEHDIKLDEIISD